MYGKIVSFHGFELYLLGMPYSMYDVIVGSFDRYAVAEANPCLPRLQRAAPLSFE